MCPDARSTCNHKRAELESLITDSGEEVPVKFVAVTETWLWADHTDAQVNISGFNVSRSDRRSRGGGGVLLYSHENYPISEVEKYDDSFCLNGVERFPTNTPSRLIRHTALVYTLVIFRYSSLFWTLYPPSCNARRSIDMALSHWSMAKLI